MYTSDMANFQFSTILDRDDETCVYISVNYVSDLNFFWKCGRNDKVFFTMSHTNYKSKSISNTRETMYMYIYLKKEKEKKKEE